VIQKLPVLFSVDKEFQNDIPVLIVFAKIVKVVSEKSSLQIIIINASGVVQLAGVERFNREIQFFRFNFYIFW